MTHRFFPFGVLLLIIVIWTAASIVIKPPQFLRQAPIFYEDTDFQVYFTGLGWIIPSAVLFEHGYSEYPPLGLMYVRWPLIFTDNFINFHWWLWLSNALLSLGTVWLIFKLAVFVNQNSSRVNSPTVAWWLWALPSAIFFTLNRYDIWPVFLTTLALYLMFKNNFKAGWLVYGLAIMAKFYPVLLFPLFYTLGKKNNLSSGVMWYALLPIVTLSSVVAWLGGWLAVVTPYILQFSRAAEPGSLLFWLVQTVPQFKMGWYGLSMMIKLAVLVYWLAVTLIANRFNLRQHLILAALTLLLVINFNTFYSNQWWLWVLPFLTLVLSTNTIWLAGLYDVVNYLQYPVLFGRWIKFNEPLGWVVLTSTVGLRNIILFILVYILWREFKNLSIASLSTTKIVL